MKSRVKDVMTSPVVVVRDSASFKEIVKLMEEHRVSALPVVDAEQKVVGIVSEADLLLKESIEPSKNGDGPILVRRRRRIERSKAAGLVAAQVMTSPAITISPEGTLNQAARLMRERDVKRLPVVDPEGTIVGVVSRTDVLRVFLRPDAQIEEEIEHDVIEQRLWMDPTSIVIEVNEGVVTVSGMVEQRSMIPVLVGLIHGVEGVVGVESHLRYEVDDVTIRPSMVGPWGLRPYGAGG